VLLRLADVQFAVPFTIVAIAVVATLGPGVKNLVILLSIWGWAIYARTIANSVSRTKRLDFILAMRLQGASSVRILFKHIVPNIWGPVVVLWSTTAGVLILVESALSFVGLGVQAPDFSWGSMLGNSFGELRTAWWIAVFPGLVLTVTVVAFNLLGDVLRDALNPQLSRSADVYRPNLS
jgi:peptide/nickel transport system permease protein